MLDGLDQIGWEKLTHAYGPAADVPGLLRDLLSPDRKVRNAAMFELYGNIWHQNTIYEATSHAVPFLIEIAASRKTPDRFEVISYLGTLAEGRSYLDVHVERTRAAVKQGEATYLSALESEQPELCCAAAYVLSRFASNANYFLALARQFDRASHDATTRCGLANLLQHFTKNGTADPEWFIERLKSETDMAVEIQLSEAIAFSGQKFTTNAEAILLGQLLSDNLVKPHFDLLPWDIGDPIAYVIEALCSSERGRRALVARYNELLARDGPTAALDYCRYVMKDY